MSPHSNSHVLDSELDYDEYIYSIGFIKGNKKHIRVSCLYDNIRNSYNIFL